MRISLLIPTRERVDYLPASLATALAIQDPDIEIIVSDNASNDGTGDAVTKVDDPRLRYLNTGNRLSMRQNFEFALSHATGDYVIYFGDDDGIIPGQFPFLRAILEGERPDALSWDFPVFGWPIPGYGNKVGGIRFVRDRLFGAAVPMDIEERRRVIESGRMDKFFPMPAVYHGAMSLEYLREVSHPDGTCFMSRSPDTYINFRALQHGGRFLHSAHAFSINGHSPASNGGAFTLASYATVVKMHPRGCRVSWRSKRRIQSMTLYR